MASAVVAAVVSAAVVAAVVVAAAVVAAVVVVVFLGSMAASSVLNRFPLPSRSIREQTISSLARFLTKLLNPWHKHSSRSSS